ncbi:hypothetical protein QL093DRAFT_2429397 [Fusarium oxysporum]|nr:hypothetical protein QL093DRAFT_2429397 [Fusarium oxysporum]
MCAIGFYACEHNAYDVSEEIAGHRLNHSATLSWRRSPNSDLYTQQGHYVDNGIYPWVNFSC